MIVTKIERQKKNPDRYSLYLDGEFAVGVRSAVLLRAGLRRGDELTAQALEALRDDEESGAARLAALRFAGRRRRTEHEVRVKLSTLEFPPAVIDEVVASLRESGVLDDRAYVRAVIHDAQLRRPAGARMVAHRLRGKGVDAAVLREELAAGLGPEAEAPLALRVAERYAAKLGARGRGRKAPVAGEREAAIRRYLSGRGFGREAVEAALRRVLPAARGGRAGGDAD